VSCSYWEWGKAPHLSTAPRCGQSLQWSGHTVKGEAENKHSHSLYRSHDYASVKCFFIKSQSQSRFKNKTINFLCSIKTLVKKLSQNHKQFGVFSDIIMDISACGKCLHHTPTHACTHTTHTPTHNHTQPCFLITVMLQPPHK